MTYNFKNYAIKCDEWSQMEELARIAESMGYIPALFGQGSHTFENGYNVFMVCVCDFIKSSFSNWDTSAIEEETVISFHDFINQNK